MSFVQQEAPTTDVFCFQEVFSAIAPKRAITAIGQRMNFFAELKEALPDFEAEFANMSQDVGNDPAVDGNAMMGIVTFVRKTHAIVSSRSIYIANGPDTYDGKDFDTNGCVALRTDVNVDGSDIAIVHVHGTPGPGDKRDSDVRLEQSRRVLSLTADCSTPNIILGDFNLYPDTESIQMIERAGYRNLVVEYGIQTTRGSNLRKMFPQYEHGKYGFQEFADYVFVSPGIRVIEFAVPDLPLSDHLPLILSAEIETPTSEELR